MLFRSTAAVDAAAEGRISQLLKRGDLDDKAGATLMLHALPGLATTPVEATYLAWIDCRGLIAERGIPNAAAFFEAAGVGLSNGADFGLPGWVRLNFGCPGATLEAALQRMEQACRQR